MPPPPAASATIAYLFAEEPGVVVQVTDAHRPEFLARLR